MKQRNYRILFLLVLLLAVLVPATAFAAPSEFDELRQKGWLWAFLGVFAAGFLTSLTPCVYPMITITVGIFGAREATSRLRAFGLAAMYVLGMIAMYSTLGVVFAITGRATGAGFLLSQPAFVIPIVVFYLVLAASMFGVFELNLPPALQARLSGVGGRGTLGAFLMGLVGGLTAAPCTGPMLLGLLAFIATTRDALLGASLMTTYAVGMGVLVVTIATFALRLPKSGAWMEVVKAIGGIALLVVAVYFLRPVWPAVARLTSRGQTFLVAALAVGLVGIALIGLYLRRLARRGPTRAAMLLKAAGIALTTAGAALAMNWILTPKRSLPWRLDREVALADARASGQPSIIDFWASWCVPCQVYEAKLFSDPAVHDELASRFMPVKFDVTKQDAADRRAMSQWGAALPTVIILRPDGTEAGRFTESPSPDSFLAKLRAAR
jgi:thioredoxin:protein disulfide reductase